MQQYIDNAVEQFKTLLTQQIARQQQMEKNNECMKICIFSEFKAAQSNFFRKNKKK